MYDTNTPSLDADAFLETVDKGIQCTDPAERQTYFADAQKMAIDSNTMIPLISQQALFIYNEDYLDDDAFFASVYIKPNELK
jgi:ABC-type transport system substrate-binding protein